MFKVGVVVWENEDPVVASDFLKMEDDLIPNESATETQCIGVFPDKNISRLVQKVCSAKAPGAICKKKGTILKPIYAGIGPKEHSPKKNR